VAAEEPALIGVGLPRRPSGSRQLDDFLRSGYREDSRFGDYVVLVPR